MPNIYDFNVSYSLVKRYVIFIFKRYYGKYIVTGRENIPHEGPVIFAANHLNALMDALAVISILPHHMSIVYLGRADLFKNKAFASVLQFSKILPAFRMRDGVENLEKNHGIFECCVDVLDHNKVLGIMPEGNQGPYRKLRPLVKGIFRIAFSAQQKYGSQPGVKIVPIGIDMGDFDKFGEHLIINIGKPIEVSEYMAEFTENPAGATNQIRERLRMELSQLTFNLATENYYDCFETAIEVADSHIDQKLQRSTSLLDRFTIRQKIVETLLSLEKNEPETAEELASICQEYKDNLKELNLNSSVFGEKSSTLFALFLKCILLTATLPVFIVGFVFNLLPFFSPERIRKAMKIEYPGGLSSVRFGISLITFPVFYLLQGILICVLLKFQWWCLFLVIPLQYLFGLLAFQWYQSLKKIQTRFHFHTMKKEKSAKMEQTKLLYQKINEIAHR